MLDLRTITVLSGLFAVIACLTAIASSPIGNPDQEAATAAAVRYHLREFLEFNNLAAGDEKLKEIVICVTSDVPLNISLVSQKLTDTIIRTVPATSCSSKTVEGSFGMFVSITNYFGPDGEAAGHLAVRRVSCATTRRCVIDIDERGSGSRFWVERSGQIWKVMDARLRWIV